MATAGWYKDYPMCELEITNITLSGRTTNSVNISFTIIGRVNGYFKSPNYGGTWHVKKDSTSGAQIASGTWINATTGYGSNNGQWAQVYSTTASGTISGLSSSATSATLCLQSYCQNSSWTSLNFSTTFSISFAAGAIEVSSISLPYSSYTTSVGRSFRLPVTVNPSNATNKSITWSSTNSGVANVDSGDTVTAKGAGSCTITARSNNGKTASCSVTVFNNTGPSGSLNAIADPTWSNEQLVRINHQSKYGLTVGGTYASSLTVGGSNVNKVTVGGSKVWFRRKDVSSAIGCNNFTRNGSTSGNSSGGCATIDHCSNLFSSNRSNPISPKTITLSYKFSSWHSVSSNQYARVKIFGLNSNGNWIELPLSGNSFYIANGNGSASGNLTITCSTKNFFTNFKIGIFPDNKNYFVHEAQLTNIRITNYGVDASVE